MASAIHRADGSGLLEDPGNLRVHLDVKVALECPLFVPLIDPCINPIRKGLSNNCVNDVGNILAWQLLELSLNQRQGSQNIRVPHGKFHNMFDCQPFKLRNNDMLYVLRFYHPSASIDQIFHVPYGHGFKAGKVGPNIMCKETVNLTFTSVLGTKLLGGHQLKLLRSRIDLVDLTLAIKVIRHLLFEITFFELNEGI